MTGSASFGGREFRAARRAAVAARLRSWVWDYLIILGWLASTALLVGVPVMLGILDLETLWSQALTRDVIVAMVTVVPLLVYLIVTENGPNRATLGKRRVGLMVVTVEGARVGLLRLVVRNVVKVLPWQLGHISAVRFASGEPQAATTYVVFIASMLLLALVLGPVLLGCRGMHDVAAATKLVAADR